MRFYGAEYNNIELGIRLVQYCCTLLHKTSYWSRSSAVIVYYYKMILFKLFYWLSCCHLTFRKIGYCLIKTRIDLVSLSLSFFILMYCTVFCIGQYKFLWTLEINIHLSLKASVNIDFKVHKNSHWPQQKTIIVYYEILLLVLCLMLHLICHT